MDPNVNAESVGKIIQSDPAITAKLIMIANSALYKGHAPISSLNQAVVRLGLKTTREQVLIFTIKELFKEKSHAMKSNMQRLWKHSQKVASLSNCSLKSLVVLTRKKHSWLAWFMTWEKLRSCNTHNRRMPFIAMSKS